MKKEIELSNKPLCVSKETELFEDKNERVRVEEWAKTIKMLFGNGFTSFRLSEDFPPGSMQKIANSIFEVSPALSPPDVENHPKTAPFLIEDKHDKNEN